MTAPIPVTLARNGSPWRPSPDFILVELCDIVDSLALPHYRDVQGGAVEALRLDLESRRKDDNRLKLKSEKRVHDSRKINKGLAMELAVSATLCHVGRPKSVSSFCKLNPTNGLPNYFAVKGDPDILTQPSGDAPEYRIVCEVSANRAMNPKNFRKQLEGALAHCVDYKKRERVAFVYGLLLNNANVGKDKKIQKVYFDFLEEMRIGMKHSVKLIPMNAAEFVTALRRLNAAKKLSFDSRLLATAFNGLHRQLRGNIPTETEDWMAKALVENIEKGLDPRPKLPIWGKSEAKSNTGSAPS